MTPQEQKEKKEMTDLETECENAKRKVAVKKIAQDELLKSTKLKIDALRNEGEMGPGNIEYINLMLESVIKVREEEKEADRIHEAAQIKMTNRKWKK